MRSRLKCSRFPFLAHRVICCVSEKLVAIGQKRTWSNFLSTRLAALDGPDVAPHAIDRAIVLARQNSQTFAAWGDHIASSCERLVLKST